ncbi:MAG: hypothetical protein D8M58_18410 [Calditrichaeota bacterium]|nr:MAG: hypothetical protein DWQ03_11640 [Calditrichota bacterium]MBL1207384.1 hypothetical protein [Calditrichota bacterium]NOG47216.1 hypothetical protein [Calditrichota bacterium]
MYKILICDPLSDTAVEILGEAPDLQYTEAFGCSENDLIKIIPDYNAVIIRSATTITKKIIDNADNLKVIGRAGSGLDNVDTDYAAKKGIKILNTPGTNAPAVAELAIGLLFGLARSIPAADQSMKAGKWAKKDFPGVELSGKTLGLIGCGTIGKLVAKKAYNLGMDILIHNRSDVAIDSIKFKQVPQNKLYASSDFISIHLPKSPETNSFIGAAQFNLMKDNVRIVNVARGGIVNEKDLLAALNSNKVAGAAIDVYENEPNFNRELASHQSVIATPHIGASSYESQQRVGVRIIDQVLEFLRSKYIFF